MFGIGLLGIGLLGSCAATPPGEDWFAAAAGWHDVAARAVHESSGFDVIDAKAALGSGDRVEFRLRRHDVRDDRAWRICLEIVDAEVRVAEPRAVFTARSVALALPHENEASPSAGGRFEVPCARLRASVFDARGELLSEDLVLVSRVLLEHGLFGGACSADQSLVGRPRVARSQDEQQLAQLAWAELLRVVEGSEGLRELLAELVVVDPWSVLLGFGAAVDFELALAGSEPHGLVGPWSSIGDCRRVPLRVTINGDPALELSVVVAPSRSPFLAAAGIVSIVGLRPGDAQLQFTLQAVAATRGRPQRSEATDARPTRRSTRPSASTRSAAQSRRSSRSTGAAGG